MVDPDLVRVVEGDGITAPDVLRVQILLRSAFGQGQLSRDAEAHRNVNILDNHVLVAVAHSQTLALDDTLVADTHDALVRAHVQGRQRGIVVLARHPGSSITVILNPGLTLGGSAAADRRGGHAAAFARGGALGADEVPGPVDEDHAGLIVGDPLHQPIQLV